MTKDKKLILSVIKSNIKDNKALDVWLSNRFQIQRAVMRQTLKDLRGVRLETIELENKIKNVKMCIDNKR